MLFHDVEFLVGQLTPLEQDLIGSPDLSDIVHGTRDPDQLTPIRIHSIALCDQSAVLTHPIDVLRRLVVTKFGRLGEANDRLFLSNLELDLRFLERFDRLLEVLSPRIDQLFEEGAVSTVFDLEFSTTQGAGHIDDDLVQLERLDDVSVSPDSKSGLGDLMIIHRRDHDCGGIGKILTNMAHDIDPELARHVHVAEDQSKLLLLEKLSGPGAVLSLLALVPS